jgi:hypothetical protein
VIVPVGGEQDLGPDPEDDVIFFIVVGREDIVVVLNTQCQAGLEDKSPERRPERLGSGLLSLGM